MTGTSAETPEIIYETDEPVLYDVRDGVAWVTMNRVQFNNAQNSQMTYALDDAFRRAVDDPAVKAIVLAGQGACIAGGLMLAWVCDLIVASDDAFFQDPVSKMMGIPGVEYFAHGFELPPRVAKEFLLLGERMSAERAYSFGMVNKVVPRAELEAATAEMAAKLAAQQSLGMWLTKQAIHQVEDLRGKRTAMDSVFHMHHFAHAQNDLTTGNALGGVTGKSAAAENKRAEDGSR